MFVKIENYLDKENNPLILNVDRISSIRKFNKIYDALMFGENIVESYIVIMDTLNKYLLNQEQYDQVCKILTKGIN